MKNPKTVLSKAVANSNGPVGQGNTLFNDTATNDDAKPQAQLSRRNFLRAATAVTGGTALAAGANLSARAAEMSHDKRNLQMATGGNLEVGR